MPGIRKWLGGSLALPCIALICLLFGLSIDCHAQTKVEGWAKVPGNTVWLEPGRHAYEHDTGLVRDLQTGQKFMPITPQSLQTKQPTLSPALPYVIVPQQPTLATPYRLPPATPTYPQSYPLVVLPYADYGPGNIYATAAPCNGCGAKGVSRPGAINARWATANLPR